MGASGNALLAFVNKSGSAKKLNIHSVEIYNNNRLGFNQGSNTNTPTPMPFRLADVTAVGVGEALTPAPHDSSASWPATVTCKTNVGVTPVWNQVGPSLTASGATAGSSTFTPTTSSIPSWYTNEHQIGNRYLVISAGGNAGTYRIISNTATALTLSHPLVSTASTTGYLAELKTFASTALVKTLRTDTTTSFPVMNHGFSGYRMLSTGALFNKSTHANTQPITVREGEKLALLCDFINHSFPVFVSVKLRTEGTPDRTFTVEFYTQATGEYDALFAIDNAAGSGEVIYVDGVNVSEVGTLDTCYFQLVPISQVSAVTYNDSSKIITGEAKAFNSTAPALSSSIAEIFVNTPVQPSGVPISYIAQGSVNALPKGFSYLNTKDFIGPVYMTYFPEAAAHKPDAYGATYWSTNTPGTLGTQLSQRLSSIKGTYAPIVIREGEGFGIVSGAETAAGATVNSVGVSGWEAYEFGITFSVEEAYIPNLELTGMVPGSRYRVETSAGVYVTDGTADGTGAMTFPFTATTPANLRIRVRKGSASSKYLPYEVSATITSAGLSIPVSQILDPIA